MMKQTLMAVYAHADDIELNAGGTLSKYHQAGYEILYVMSTNNMSGNWSSLDDSGQRQVRQIAWDEIMPQRKKEAAAAAGFYGTEAILSHSMESGNIEHVASCLLVAAADQKARHGMVDV